jgi:hypothetical protein
VQHVDHRGRLLAAISGGEGDLDEAFAIRIYGLESFSRFRASDTAQYSSKYASVPNLGTNSRANLAMGPHVYTGIHPSSRPP